ncbi:outer membrane protein OmpK [Methylomonas methanica]|nr:outer membrane protein OmpK [Methylomonas methanica]
MPDHSHFYPFYLGIITATLAQPCPADFMQWHNSEIQYLHGGNYQEPFNPNDVSQSIITITNAHGWTYGRNFFFMDALFTESGQPSQTNLYGEAYSTLSLSKISGLNLSYGIFKDFGATGGINLGENMDSPQSGTRAWLYGITLDFDLPGFDYFNVDFLRMRVTEPADIGTSWQITPTWKLPFEIAGSKWSFEGFADFIGKKGDRADRQALAQPQLRLDIGDLWGNGNHLYLGIEYQYWHNKYGIKGLHDNVPQALLLWKF